jgi:hypothetical protein
MKRLQWEGRQAPQICTSLRASKNNRHETPVQAVSRISREERERERGGERKQGIERVE